MSEDKLEKFYLDEHGFFIPNAGDGVAIAGHKKQCKKCGRKIFAQLPLFGIPHHFDVHVVCAECLEVDEEFMKEYPEISADLIKWKKDE